MGQAGAVIAGVGDQQDFRVTRPPMPRGDQPADHAAHLPGGDGRRVVPRDQPDRVERAVHELRPVSRATITE